MGLGRGAFDTAFGKQGKPYLLHDRTPNTDILIRLHDACYQLHRTLFVQYGWNTDIVFSRPNYAKIDLLGTRPNGVMQIGGDVSNFLPFLKMQAR